MSVEKSPALKMIFVLVAFCLASAAALGYIYGISEERIEHNRRQVIKQSIFNVIPDIADYAVLPEDSRIFQGLSEDGSVIGYAVQKGGIGFQGEIVLVVGMDGHLEKITGVDVVETVETPGLGDRIREADFLEQFRNMEIPHDGQIEVDGITGATMSSDAVKRIIEDSIKDAEKRIH